LVFKINGFLIYSEVLEHESQLRRTSFIARRRRATKTGGGGIRTPSGTKNKPLQNRNKTHIKPTQKLSKTDTYKNRKNSDLNKTSTSSEQDNNSSLHKKCAICVHQNHEAGDNLSPELAKLIRLWPKLPGHIKMSIRALIEL